MAATGGDDGTGDDVLCDMWVAGMLFGAVASRQIQSSPSPDTSPNPGPAVFLQRNGATT